MNAESMLTHTQDLVKILFLKFVTYLRKFNNSYFTLQCFLLT